MTADVEYITPETSVSAEAVLARAAQKICPNAKVLVLYYDPADSQFYWTNNTTNQENAWLLHRALQEMLT